MVKYNICIGNHLFAGLHNLSVLCVSILVFVSHTVFYKCCSFGYPCDFFVCMLWFICSFGETYVCVSYANKNLESWILSNTASLCNSLTSNHKPSVVPKWTTLHHWYLKQWCIIRRISIIRFSHLIKWIDMCSDYISLNIFSIAEIKETWIFCHRQTIFV